MQALILSRSGGTLPCPGLQRRIRPACPAGTRAGTRVTVPGARPQACELSPSRCCQHVVFLVVVKAGCVSPKQGFF